MKVLVIGSEGQLGSEVCKVFADEQLCRADLAGGDVRLDIADGERVRGVIVDEQAPDLVINTAGAINVPRCEEEPEWAFRLNAVAAKNLASACRDGGARLVHISTDYVFGHGGARPYEEADSPAPLSYYGASKLAGEHLVAAHCSDYAIVRTAAIYGPAPCRAKEGMNFVKMMLHLAETRDEVRVVTDEVTTPTYTVSLAEQVKLIATQGRSGLYHATCQGQCSWYEFAKAIFDVSGVQVRLVETTTADFPSPVKRPEYSVLRNKYLQEQELDVMPHWREALEAYLAAS